MYHILDKRPITSGCSAVLSLGQSSGGVFYSMRAQLSRGTCQYYSTSQLAVFSLYIPCNDYLWIYVVLSFANHVGDINGDALFVWSVAVIRGE